MTSPISSSAGKLAVTLNAHYLSETAPGNVNILAGISTYGGNLTIGGGFDPYQTPAIGYGISGVLGTNTPVQRYGVYITNGAIINTAVGNINIRGRGYDNNSSDSDGINLYNAQLLTSASSSFNEGNIYLNGRAGDNGSGGGTAGVSANLSLIQAGTFGGVTLLGQGGISGTSANANDSYIRGVKISGSTIRAQNGTLSITGRGGDATGIENKGVLIEQRGAVASVIESTGTGNISIGGNACWYTTCTNVPTYGNDGVFIRNVSSTIRSVSGGISISGRGAGTGTGYIGNDANMGVHNEGLITNASATGTLNSIGINGTGGRGGNNGIGFAVPVNMARNVLERLVSGGKVSRGYLGIVPQDIDANLAKQFNLPTQNGALVGDVMADTPAAKAGLKSGDVITAINAKPITDAHNLQLTVSQLAPGTVATLKIIRSGSVKTVSVTLGELPGNAIAGGDKDDNAENDPARADALDGVAVADLEPQLRSQLRVPAAIQGAIITEVSSGSNSAEAGLQPNDIIVEINRQPVANAQDAVRLCRAARDEQILVKIWRRFGNSMAGTRYLSVDNTKRTK